LFPDYWCKDLLLLVQKTLPASVQFCSQFYFDLGEAPALTLFNAAKEAFLHAC